MVILVKRVCFMDMDFDHQTLSHSTMITSADISWLEVQNIFFFQFL